MPRCVDMLMCRCVDVWMCGCGRYIEGRSYWVNGTAAELRDFYDRKKLLRTSKKIEVGVDIEARYVRQSC
jgi:hypothetical protein